MEERSAAGSLAGDWKKWMTKRKAVSTPLALCSPTLTHRQIQVTRPWNKSFHKFRLPSDSRSSDHITAQTHSPSNSTPFSSRSVGRWGCLVETQEEQIPSLPRAIFSSCPVEPCFFLPLVASSLSRQIWAGLWPAALEFYRCSSFTPSSGGPWESSTNPITRPRGFPVSFHFKSRIFFFLNSFSLFWGRGSFFYILYLNSEAFDSRTALLLFLFTLSYEMCGFVVIRGFIMFCEHFIYFLWIPLLGVYFEVVLFFDRFLKRLTWV